MMFEDPMYFEDLPEGTLFLAGNERADFKENYTTDTTYVLHSLRSLARVGQVDKWFLYLPSPIPPWEREDPYPDYLISVDDDGDPVLEVC